MLQHDQQLQVTQGSHSAVQNVSRCSGTNPEEEHSQSNGSWPSPVQLPCVPAWATWAPTSGNLISHQQCSANSSWISLGHSLTAWKVAQKKPGIILGEIFLSRETMDSQDTAPGVLRPSLECRARGLWLPFDPDPFGALWPWGNSLTLLWLFPYLLPGDPIIELDEMIWWSHTVGTQETAVTPTGSEG